MSTLKTNNIQHVDRSEPSILINTDGSVNIAGTMTYEDVTSVDAVGIITARSTIDAQGDVSIADKIIHTGDTNTAIRFPAADTISFETGGTERLSIESNGTFAFGNVTPGGNPANKNVFLCIGDSDSGIVQDGDGNIEIFANDAEIVNFNAVDGSTFTGDVTIPDKIIHSGDTNTAIRFPAADTFTVETAGSEALRVDSSGVVRIGGVTAAYNASDKLTLVNNSGNCSLTIDSTSSSESSVFFADGSTGTEAYRGYIQYKHSLDSLVFGSGGSEFMRARAWGDVNISNKLNVTGIVTASNFTSSGTVLIDTTSYSEATTDADDIIIGSTSDTQKGISIVGSTSGGIGNIYFTDGVGYKNQGRISYHHADDSLRFQSNVVERLRIGSDGTITKYWDGSTVQAVFPGSSQVNGVTAVPSQAGTPFVVGRDTGTTRSAHFAGNLKFDSGYGIDFSATGGGSNTSSEGELFDDYEEGTVNILIHDAAGSNISVQTNTYKYTKIGNKVYIEGAFVFAETGSKNGGLMVLYNLPFVPTQNGQANGTYWYDGTSDAADVTGVVYVHTNSVAYLKQATTIGQPSNNKYLTFNEIQKNSTRPLYTSFSYITNS